MRLWRVAALVALLVLWIVGCAGKTGRLTYVPLPMAPTQARVAGESQPRAEFDRVWVSHRAFVHSDSLIGLIPGTADSSKRFLGRLRRGFTSDTLHMIFYGDNRPGFRSTRLHDEYTTLGQMFRSPTKFLHGLVTIPYTLVKGLVPDLALVRDIPYRISHMPTWGREREVVSAMLAKIDSLNTRGKEITAVINTGDLVKDGRMPKQWERFLEIVKPLTSRVPYFAVAGNHERTDTEDGVENWRTATGLPVSGDRLYYCFDTADGWVRFIALDSNPLVDIGSAWSRKVQIEYSKEQIDWLVARVKEHNGPVVVMMHHPPFSAGYHRVEWQRDSVLIERRERMTRALHEAGIGVLLAGHEHAYERALLTWPDAVLITIVTGGGGSPLHVLPSQESSARLFSEYRVAGSVVKPENVFVAQTFCYTLMRLWFGGGEIVTYAVDAQSRSTEIDRVEVDLGRYGIPKIDQHKIPIPPAKGPQGPKEPDEDKTRVAASDTADAGQRILDSPSPAKTKAAKTKAKTKTGGSGSRKP